MTATYDLSGHVALITGAGGDFGRTVALRLAASGARIVLTDLTAAAEALEKTRAGCAALAGEEAVLVAPGDVTDPASVEAVFGAAIERFGVPDLVFNNAGIQGRILALQDYPVDDFARVIRVNVDGVFFVLREAGRRLRAAGQGGAIVNSASMAGVEGAANMPAYSASKGAVMSLTRAASKDFAPLGIRVNAISPAFIGPGRMWDLQTVRQAEAGQPVLLDRSGRGGASDGRRGADATGRQPGRGRQHRRLAPLGRIVVPHRPEPHRQRRHLSRAGRGVHGQRDGPGPLRRGVLAGGVVGDRVSWSPRRSRARAGCVPRGAVPSGQRGEPTCPGPGDEGMVHPVTIQPNDDTWTGARVAPPSSRPIPLAIVPRQGEASAPTAHPAYPSWRSRSWCLRHRLGRGSVARRIGSIAPRSATAVTPAR